jgi:hypothetical protein
LFRKVNRAGQDASSPEGDDGGMEYALEGADEQQADS